MHVEQFFQSAPGGSHQPPSKKRRVDTSVADEVHETAEADDAMPDYHEHEDASEIVWDVDADVEEADANAGQVFNTEHKNDPPNQAASSSSESSQICPICQKVLQGLDNVAINTHLDFCLSKGVIMEATSTISGSSAGSVKSKKPASRSLTSWVGKR